MLEKGGEICAGEWRIETFLHHVSTLHISGETRWRVEEACKRMEERDMLGNGGEKHISSCSMSLEL